MPYFPFCEGFSCVLNGFESRVAQCIVAPNGRLCWSDLVPSFLHKLKMVCHPESSALFSMDLTRGHMPLVQDDRCDSFQMWAWNDPITCFYRSDDEYGCLAGWWSQISCIFPSIWDFACRTHAALDCQSAIGRPLLSKWKCRLTLSQAADSFAYGNRDGWWTNADSA